MTNPLRDGSRAVSLGSVAPEPLSEPLLTFQAYPGTYVSAAYQA
jgi:hypothetical protein